MSGFGLIHLGFVAATAAVAVPILIHLLLRPRARRVEIGTLRFLKRVLKDSTRRRKLRRWLLLALRTTAVLLLALLFARPYLPGLGAEGRDREVILLIDQSASMAATQAVGRVSNASDLRTAFARAQEAADKILRELPEHTVAQLAYFDGQGVVPAAEVRIDPERRPGYADTDFGHALRWARDRLVLSPRPQRQVYLFTDLQRSGLRETSVEGFPSDVDLEVVEVGQPLLKNLAVIQAGATQTLIRPGQPIAVTAGVLNAGPFPAKNARVRLVLESVGRVSNASFGAGPRVEQTQTLSIGPAAVSEVRFTPPIQRAGLYWGFVEVTGDDDFPLDDRRWLAFEARPPDRLLLVDGKPGRTVFGNETYYLEAALRLRLPGQGTPLTTYEPERLPWIEGTILPALDRFRLAILCNVARLAEGDIIRLRTFVAAGGSLLVFTGSRVEPDNYAALEWAGLVPAVVGETQGPDSFHFAEWDKEHPIFRPLSDPQQGDLRRLSFHHLTRVKAASGARVLAAAQTGDPLLVEAKLKKGTILLFASAANRDWSDWPQTPLYVPLVHQIVGYLTGRLPENQRVQQAPTGPGRDNPPGVTRVGDVVLVRNLDPRESEIERLTPAQFRAAFHMPEPDRDGKKREAVAGAQLPPGGHRPDELWVYVVWILLLVLVAEVFLANRTHA